MKKNNIFVSTGTIIGVVMPIALLSVSISCSKKPKEIKAELTKANNLGFNSTSGNNKPTKLGDEPTKAQIDAYNLQMNKYNSDQVAQSKEGIINSVKPKDLGFVSAPKNDKPKPLGEMSTKIQINAYNLQMNKYNSDQVAQSKEGIINSVKPKDLGFA